MKTKKQRTRALKSSTNVNLDLYKKIYLIRACEKAIIENYSSDEMKTPMHMSMGEEAIVAGVCQGLLATDQVLGTYRSHALYLAKVGDVDKFFAEMYGKKTGAVEGKGGSMHLSAPQRGLLATSAVVASTIPVAVGAAFANKIKKNRKVVAVFFGDGALDEGVFWESLNAACLMCLPVVFVCEDNNLAVHTKKNQRQGYKSIKRIISNFNCDFLEFKTTNAYEIFRIVTSKLSSVRTKFRPLFINAYYFRYLEHVGVNEDFDAGYRSIDEFKKWKRKDPVKLQKELAVKIGVGLEEIERVENSINSQIAKSIDFAKKSPFAMPEYLFKDLFYEK